MSETRVPVRRASRQFVGWVGSPNDRWQVVRSPNESVVSVGKRVDLAAYVDRTYGQVQRTSGPHGYHFYAPRPADPGGPARWQSLGRWTTDVRSSWHRTLSSLA